MKTIVVTGATGLLGGAFLFELMVKPDDQVGRIVVLGGSGEFSTLRERLEAALAEHGLVYLGLQADDVPRLMARVETMHMRLDEPGLGLSADDLATLRGLEIDSFVHIAGLTTFKQDPKAAADCKRVNVDGLASLLDVCDGLRIRRFVHLGSAYSAGRLHGHCAPDDDDPDGDFHNPYQRSKADGERMVRGWASERGDMELIVVRPSTIGGRLITAPRGHVTKYDVFLGWAKGMMRLKGMLAGGLRASHDTPMDIPLRLTIHPTAGLNIVPTDWAARCLAVVALDDDLGHGSYHLANARSTPHSVYVPQIIDAVGIGGVTFMDHRPTDPSMLETAYHERLGWVFADYVEHPDLTFDRTNQQELETKAGVPCPPVDAEAFAHLLAYGHDRHYGLDLDR